MKKDQAIKILQKLIDGAGELSQQSIGSVAFNKWYRSTKLAVGRIFGETSQHMQEFSAIRFESDRATLLPEIYFKAGVAKSRGLLESMLEEVQDYWQDEGEDFRESILSSNDSQTIAVSKPLIFIGHGRTKLWARLKIFLNDELALQTITYESESRVGEAIVTLLEKILDQASFAILVLTAEDETSEGLRRARQNVVHEAGLFQGRLGFRRAILIRQEGLEDFTNVAGLQYIGFTGDRIEDSFYEIQRVLKREGIVP